MFLLIPSLKQKKYKVGSIRRCDIKMKPICVSTNYRPTKDKIHRGYFDLHFLLSDVILCRRAYKISLTIK